MGLALDAVLNALVGNFLILLEDCGERAPLRGLADYRLHSESPPSPPSWLKGSPRLCGFLPNPTIDKAVHWTFTTEGEP